MVRILLALLILVLTTLHVALFLINLKCAVKSFGSIQSQVISKNHLRQTIITDKKSNYSYALVTSEQNIEGIFSNRTNIFSAGSKKPNAVHSPVKNKNGNNKTSHFQE